MLWAVAAGSDPNNRAGTMLMAKAPPMMLIKYRAPALLAIFIRPPEGARPIWPDSTVVAGITAIVYDPQLMSGCCRGRVTRTGDLVSFESHWAASAEGSTDMHTLRATAPLTQKVELSH